MTTHTRTDKLKTLYDRAKGLNEDLPMDLMNKLSIYGQILELIGALHAEAIGAWKLAEAKRREVIASATVYDAEIEGIKVKTAVEKAAAAEVIGASVRQAEGKAEQEATRWKNAYNSTNEQINIMKKRYDHLVNVAKGGI